MLTWVLILSLGDCSPGLGASALYMDPKVGEGFFDAEKTSQERGSRLIGLRGLPLITRRYPVSWSRVAKSCRIVDRSSCRRHSALSTPNPQSPVALEVLTLGNKLPRLS